MKLIKSSLIGFVGVALIYLFPGVKPAEAQFVAEAVAEKVRDSVVTLESISAGYASAMWFGAGFAGVSVSAESAQRKLVRTFSTGFILDKTGYILAPESEVSGADMVEVTFSDGTKGEADVVVLDEGWGIALLKLRTPPKNLKPIVFGDSDKVVQGDSVVVVGSAGGYGSTVSYGIVSAIRPVRLPSGQLVQDMIQSDVVVNVGNQGSPLFNANGEVIGIHAVRAVSGGYLQNVTFYMPSNLLKRLYPQLIETKAPAFRPFMGILPYTGLNDALRMYLGLPDEYWDVGVLIDRVWEGSPAYDSGLSRQDFIVKVDGELVRSIGELEKIIYNAKKDQIFVVGFIRQHRYQELEVKVGNHPEEALIGYI